MSENAPLYFSDKNILDKIPKGYHPEALTFLALIRSEGFSPETMEHQVQRLKAAGKKASTINKNISAMRSVVRAIYETGVIHPALAWEIETNMKKVRFVKKASRAVTEGSVISQDEYERLKAAGGPRIALVMSFLWETGCRVSEALHVRLSDCKAEMDVVRVYVWGKGRKERVLRVRPLLYYRILETFGGETWLFESRRKSPRSGEKVPLHDRGVDKEIRRIGREVLGRNVSPHMFRHSFATRMIEKGVDVKAVSKYLGHSSTAITMDLYVHTEPTNEELGIFS